MNISLKGKKTYIAATLMALATAALVLGVIDQHQYEAALGLLNALGLAGLRAGVALGPKQPEGK